MSLTRGYNNKWSLILAKDTINNLIAWEILNIILDKIQPFHQHNITFGEKVSDVAFHKDNKLQLDLVNTFFIYVTPSRYCIHN